MPQISEEPSTGTIIARLTYQVYLPNLLITIGQGAMIPVLVYAAHEVHGSSAEAGLLVALNSLGTMIFDLPAGRLTARFGERRSIYLSAAMLIGGLAGCAMARTFWDLAAFVTLQAGGWALWSLARMVHLSRVAPLGARGRALSLFGGVIRGGNVIGPFVFVGLATRSDARVAFVIYLVCAVIGVIWLVAAQDPADAEAAGARASSVHPWRLLSEHRRELATAGTGALGVSLLRGSRAAIVPLWAAHIGLDARQAATIYAVSSVVDLALFYPAGILSDRRGRRAVLLPCMAMLSAGHIAIPFTHSATGLFWVAFVLGLGNGFGSGIVMTLGADLTPTESRASFLAVWRVISDGGTTAGPLVDAGIVGLGAIALAGPAMGALGFAATAVVAMWMEEPAPKLKARRQAAREERSQAPGAPPRP